SGSWSIRPNVEKLPYDVFKDFTPIAYVMTTYTGLVVRKDSPFDSVAALVAQARQNPGKVTFASSGVGGYSHLLGEPLKLAAGIDIYHIPYSGSAPAMTDLLAGRIDILFDSAPVEHVKAGQVKALAAMGPSRIAQLPQIPTIFEIFPDFLVGDSGWGVM